MKDRPVKRLGGIALLVCFGLCLSVLPLIRLGSGVDPTPLAAAEILSIFLWTVITWAGAYWLWLSRAVGEDVAVVVGWVGAMGANFGFVAWAIIEQQLSAGVVLSDPWLLVNGVTGAGMVTGLLVGYFHTLSRSKTRLIERKRAMLERRSEQLAFLTQLLRHDIRNDVAVIQGYVDLIAPDGENGEYVDRIRSKSDHIQELLTAAREVLDALDAEETETIALEPVLYDAVDHVRTDYPHANISVDYDLPTGVSVSANRLLESVFENLLRNAVQHNTAAEPTVDVTATATDETVTVRVADNGPGLSDARKESIFDPGQKGEGSTGMGLGLYLIDMVLNSYGADVWVEDNVAGDVADIAEANNADTAAATDTNPAADIDPDTAAETEPEPSATHSRGAVFVVKLRRIA